MQNLLLVAVGLLVSMLLVGGGLFVFLDGEMEWEDSEGIPEK